MKIRDFIQENFLIDKAETGEFVPFIFNRVQNKYYDMLVKEYSEEKNFQNLREMILKARKEGFTSLILGIFAAIMCLSKNASRFLEISYKEDATVQHFRRCKNFILSWLSKDPQKWEKIENKVFKNLNDGQEFILRDNLSSFFVGTASVKTGERGGTVQGVLFSEDAHYPTTGIISAKEIIEGTRNMVAVGHGIIFRESTGNGYTHYRHDWEMAKRKEVDYKPRFFSWKEFYAPEQFEQIKLGFSDKAMIRQEYPETDVEAFLASEEMVVIDRHDIEACVNNRKPCAAVKRITVCDVAGDGINKSSGDETVIYDMLNTEIKDQEIYRHRDLMDTIGRLVVHQKKNHSNMICVDKVGEGSGVYSRLAEIYAGDAGVTIYGFDGRISAPKPHDETYSNYKTYAWFNARAMFREVQCNIPNDSILKDQLACVTYKNHLREKRILTSKEEIKEKLRASPDRADAYVMGLDALTYAVPLSEGQIAEIEKNGWQGGDFVPVRPNSTKRLVCA